MNRFVVAMCTYAVLAAIAWVKLTAPIPGSQYQVRHVVIVIMAALAVSTWVHRRDPKEVDPENGKDVESGSSQQ
jgi:predicted anti-sigma-YlaC factor YlaD